MSLPIFINTRPKVRINDELMTALTNRGIKTYSLPLLELCPLPYQEHDRACMEKLLQGYYDVLVVISITAVEQALLVLTRTQRERLKVLIATGQLKVLAVGQATAQALREMGIVVQTPPVANNESMIHMPMIQHVLNTPTAKVLFWRGVGGRKLLRQTLMAHGVVVDSIKWYQRVASHTLSSDVINILPNLQHRRVFVLISSEMAFDSWVQAWQTHSEWYRQFCYLTLGERLHTLVNRHGCDSKMLVDLECESIVTAITQEILDK